MDTLLEILADIRDDVDFENTKDLVDGKYIDSLTVLQIIAEINDEYDISVPAEEIIPANFNSVEGMWDMIQRLQDE